MDLREELFKNRDLKYKNFHKKLVPNIDESKIIGVRVPTVRKIAKKAFLANAQNQCEYYEEIEAFGFCAAMKKCGATEHKRDIEKFVSMTDNWGTCDTCTAAMKFIGESKSEYFDFICSFIGRGEYPTRFAIVALMDYYLDDEYIDRVLKIYSEIKSDKYYINMALAWALSMAFIKHKGKVMPILESRTLNADVQNKTIQKICDSYRVSKETKSKIKEYKIR